MDDLGQGRDIKNSTLVAAALPGVQVQSIDLGQAEAEPFFTHDWGGPLPLRNRSKGKTRAKWELIC